MTVVDDDAIAQIVEHVKKMIAWMMWKTVPVLPL